MLYSWPMRTLTLAQARENYASTLAALSRATNATAYSTSDVSLQRENVAELRSQLAFWEKQVAELSAFPSVENPSFILPRFN